ncbi:MAG: protealysin inhibitor emfourin [Cyanobacteria bacterium P01_D01_bin.105]
MKVFIQREGGHLPNYMPKGTIDTDDLSPEEAKTIVDALKPETLKPETFTGKGVRAANNHRTVADGYAYHVRIQQNNAVQEFDVQENALPPDVQDALHLLIQKVSQ